MNERQLFIAALERRNAAERSAFLEATCGTDAKLRDQIERLLREHEQLGSFLEAPAATVDRQSIAERPGTVIGPYKLLEQIGEGGFGIVFMAEQQQPVRRKVALKVLRPGMDTRQVIARFEAERQALALMEHPNIAKVLDAGATDSGRPYFVMELVKGLPINEYCDRNQMTTRERLELFVSVCQAVQHAHHKGIIHRDLKPTNVLVTEHDGTPVVKVIDFGIAKATGQQLTDKTLFTNFAQMLGSPLYMSPEQAALSDLDIDTRSDIYSLGVLLYELLTGTTPFEQGRFRDAAYDEIRRIIREEEPAKPSTRISTMGQAGSTVSAQRKTDPKRLCQLLRGDLDWIVIKALEKDRTRRYESANAFAADVQHYLKDEPIQARPPSAGYRLRKFARRHKAGLASATLGCVVLAVLVAAGIVYGVQQDRQQRQRAATAQKVMDDLKEADTWRREEQWAKALRALERARGRLERDDPGTLKKRVDEEYRELELVGQLEVAQAQMSNVAFGYLSDYTLADRVFKAAFQGYGINWNAPADEIASKIRASAIRSRLVMALDYWAYIKQFRVGGDARQLWAVARLADDDSLRQQLRDLDSISDRKALLGLAERDDVLAQPPVFLSILSKFLEKAGARGASLRLLRRARQRYPADFWINFGLAMQLRGEALPQEAVCYCRVAIALQPDNPIGHSQLSWALWDQGDWPDALAAMRKAIELGPGNALLYHQLGDQLYSQQKVLEAEAANRNAIKLQVGFAWAYHDLANMLYLQGRFPEALAAAQKAVELAPDLANAYNSLAFILRALQRFADAEAAQRKAIALNEALAEANSGFLLMAQGSFAEALVAFKRAHGMNSANNQYFASEVRWAERWLRLDGKLSGIMRGEPPPTAPAELLALADFSQLRCHQHYAAATRFYVAAFAADPGFVDDRRTATRYRAACAAVLAGLGQGKDGAQLSTQERCSLRRQALLWLRADLDGWHAEFSHDPARSSHAVVEEMRQWQRDTALDGVRAAEPLARLPEAERQEWQNLWLEVESLERRAAQVEQQADAKQR